MPQLRFFFVKFLAFSLGCFSCFLLHENAHMAIVLAAATTGLVGTFIPFPKQFGHHPYAAIYAGSFAGMCSAAVITNLWQLSFISFIGAGLYVYTRELFAGFGGRLGSIAFVSVAIFVLAKGMIT